MKATASCGLDCKEGEVCKNNYHKHMHKITGIKSTKELKDHLVI